MRWLTKCAVLRRGFIFPPVPRLQNKAKQWAAEIDALLRTAGGDNRRLAVDKINPEGAAALAEFGITIVCGEELMEQARLIKCADEVLATRCAIAACDKAIEKMAVHAKPGISETRLWSILHAENIARGGEWIETRILSAGPRTNPWFQECSSRPIKAGELLAFDTDLIGAYGACVDISRTWLVGADKPTAPQLDLFRMAREQAWRNMELLRPGITWRELSEKAHVYCPQTYRHYASVCHGVGLCDEYPEVHMPHCWEDGDDNAAQVGMTMCVESYVARRDGGEGVKYEEQVLITEKGAELLSFYPGGLSPF